MKFKEKTRIPINGKLRNFLIDQLLDRRLTAAAEKENTSVSALIRRYCHEGLDRENTISRAGTAY